MTEYRLTFSNDIYPDTVTIFKNQLCNILALNDVENLIVLFSSDGGSTDQSVALYTFIQSINFPIHMHAIGHIGSVAIPVFLSADKRTADPKARFFFHEYHWTFDGQQTLNRINESVQRLRNDIDVAQEIIREKTEVSDDVIMAIDGNRPPALLQSTEALEVGIINDILNLEKVGSNGSKVQNWSA
ncbi:MAG: ATP-dependent Clp protease proteolytic subunit [Gammaproteobacteria bacterium]|nr:ATP-dependent Clp protease proteolytic subunit [Gammaproteobacteria bacterium]